MPDSSAAGLIRLERFPARTAGRAAHAPYDRQNVSGFTHLNVSGSRRAPTGFTSFSNMPKRDA
jgi:hypothetical protein